MINIVLKSCTGDGYSLSKKSINRMRLFSIIALVGFPTFSILEMFNLLDGLNKPVHFFVTLALLLSFTPLIGSRMYNHFFRFKGQLDEREKHAVQRAMSFSYKAIIGTLIVLIIIGLTSTYAMGLDIRSPAISVAAAAMIAMNIAFLIMFLPITYIAWTQKPLPAEY